MIKNILPLIIALFVFNGLSAQRFPGGPPPSFEEKEAQIKAHKIAFLTEQLNLSPEEAQLFWPEYNEYSLKESAIRAEHKALRKKMRDADQFSDAEVEEGMIKYIQSEKAEVELKESYHPRFIKVLGVRKTLQLYKAENEFKRVLLRRLKGGGGPH